MNDEGPASGTLRELVPEPSADAATFSTGAAAEATIEEVGRFSRTCSPLLNRSAGDINFLVSGVLRLGFVGTSVTVSQMKENS